MSSGCAWAVLVLLVAGHAEAQEGPEDAYRAIVSAFERGDDEAYFGGFAPTLFCFYGSRDVPLARVRAQRRELLTGNRRDPGHSVLRIDELAVELESEDRVVLRDRGAHGTRGRERDHAKAVLMVRTDRWRIAGEGGYGSLCYGELMRSEVVTGVDPLASEDGVWSALQRYDDLVTLGRGVLWIDGEEDAPHASCHSQVSYFPDQRSELSCDASVRRCVLDNVVLRFRQRRSRRELIAVVRYAEGAVLPRERMAVERLVRRRDELCELHDRLYRGDASLASDDVWQLRPGGTEAPPPPRHVCGEAALRLSRGAIRAFAGGSLPLVCSSTYCGLALDGTGDPHLVMRRNGGRLQLWIDGLEWILGDSLRPIDWERMRTTRCPSE